MFGSGFFKVVEDKLVHARSVKLSDGTLITAAHRRKVKFPVEGWHYFRNLASALGQFGLKVGTKVVHVATYGLDVVEAAVVKEAAKVEAAVKVEAPKVEAAVKVEAAKVEKAVEAEVNKVAAAVEKATAPAEEAPVAPVATPAPEAATPAT
jgi:phage baseplate assembly protein gpV